MRIINSRLFEEERVENEAFDIGYSYTVVRDLDFYRFFEKNLSRVRKVDVLRIFERYIKEDKYSEILMVPEDGNKSR
ncbi:MAG: insulinase family protein, partial [Aquifex sp.]